MKSINTVWLQYHPDLPNRGGISMHILDDLFSGAISPWTRYNFSHHESFSEISRSESNNGGVIVTVAGMTHQWMKDILKLNDDLVRFQWAIVISVSDEGNYFKFEELQHRKLRVWTQETHPNRKPSHRLMCGPSANSGLLKQFFNQPKTLDWMFAGQVKEYRRRQDCVRRLKQMSGGILVETGGFQEEKLSPKDYYRTMASAKVVPCPGGTDSPDAWRTWDAFNAGCIPILDDKTQFDSYPSGYWVKMFGEQPPVPVIQNWDDLPAVMEDLLTGWETKSSVVKDWWGSYKHKLVNTLENEIEELDQ